MGSLFTYTQDDNDLRQKRTKVIASGLTAVLLSGCALFTPYEPELKQGNFVKEEQLQQLQTGMSAEQVQFLLGTPMLTGESPGDRWIYPIHEDEGEYRHIIVDFENGQVSRISRSS